ncbi:MAG: bifunctional homocysteine S-methyltransferase/methylenetetrahydrofolate reductase [Bdellovibrio sp.]|nr:MAG: bifunctional homocysteine S-methyltransferase/methylenetetrahydrofolate reductase [Bdellovibrio sp.]
MKKLLDEIGSRCLVADGGIATSLYDKGFYINRSFEELCLTHPKEVKDVHLGFKNAGAEILHTNTFSATEPKLIEYGIHEQLEDILKAAVELAREVSDGKTLVVGSIGPLGIVLEPLGPVSIEEAEELFLKNIRIFEKEKVDAINFIGFHDLNELGAGIKAARQAFSGPIWAHIGVQENMRTSYGHTLKEFVDLCEEEGVQVLGVAGEVGPSGALTALEQLKVLTSKPISLLPNAGLPRFVNDQYIYLCNPDYLGKYAKRFALGGASVIGGHSGVSATHIQAVSNALKVVKAPAHEGENQKEKSTNFLVEAVDKPQEPKPIEARSQLGKCLKEGTRVFTVEVLPPRGVDFSGFIKKCQQLENAGVRFVNIPDGARAVARMGSLELGSYILSHFHQLEPIPHVTTRDRNLIGLQSSLLGAFANGVRNVLLVTGDPPKLGNCPGATAVYDVDAIGLTHIVNRMNQGLDIGGSSFGKPAEFLIGVALNPTAQNRKLEIQRFRYKVEAGADFAITQPIYDLNMYQKFMDELGDVSVPIVMGIWPLVSFRNAEFLKNEVPGVFVPDWILEEMEKVRDNPQDSIKKGEEIACQVITEAKNFVAGFQISAPFNKVEVALDVIKKTES